MDTARPTVAHAAIENTRLLSALASHNDGTERCGRPTACQLATDVARPHSLE